MCKLIKIYFCLKESGLMNTEVTPPLSESEVGDSTPLQIHVC